MSLKDKLTALQGPALIVFSVGCIGAAALVQQTQQSTDFAQGLAAPADCMEFGFDTPQGRVGCLTQVILPLDDGPYDESIFE